MYSAFIGIRHTLPPTMYISASVGVTVTERERYGREEDLFNRMRNIMILCRVSQPGTIDEGLILHQ